MSILDELGDIADANAFGRKPVGFTGRAQPKKPFTETCRRGHPRTDENTYRHKTAGRLWLVCRECRRVTQNARRGKQSPTEG